MRAIIPSFVMHLAKGVTNFLICIWDVPVTTQAARGASVDSLTDNGIKKIYILYCKKVVYILVFIYYIAHFFKNFLKYKMYVHLQQLC